MDAVHDGAGAGAGMERSLLLRAVPAFKAELERVPETERASSLTLYRLYSLFCMRTLVQCPCRDQSSPTRTRTRTIGAATPSPRHVYAYRPTTYQRVGRLGGHPAARRQYLDQEPWLAGSCFVLWTWLWWLLSPLLLPAGLLG